MLAVCDATHAIGGCLLVADPAARLFFYIISRGSQLDHLVLLLPPLLLGLLLVLRLGQWPIIFFFDP